MDTTKNCRLQSWTLYKSADCRRASTTILCVSFTNSVTVRRLKQVQHCNRLIDQSADNITGLKCAKECLILKYKYIQNPWLDHHRAHCTAITKQLKFYARLVMRVDPYTLQGKSVTVPLKLGEIRCHKHWSDLFILESWKRSWDDCIINNSLWPMIAAITAVTRMDTQEWLSMQSLSVSPLAWLFVRPCDHLRLGPV